MINWKKCKTRTIPSVNRLVLALHLNWATIPLQFLLVSAQSSQVLFQWSAAHSWLPYAGGQAAGNEIPFDAFDAMPRQIARRTYWRLQLYGNKETKLAELFFMCGERVCESVSGDCWLKKFKCRQLCIGQCDERHCAQFVTLPPSEQRWNPTGTERAYEAYGEGRQKMCCSWEKRAVFVWLTGERRCGGAPFTWIHWPMCGMAVYRWESYGNPRLCVGVLLSFYHVFVFDRIWHMHCEPIVHPNIVVSQISGTQTMATILSTNAT